MISLVTTPDLQTQAEKAFQAKDYPGAWGLFVQLAKAHPDNERFRLRLGETCAALGRKADALKIYKHLAAQLIQAGRFALALAVSKRILEIDPRDGEMQATLRDLYAQNPELAEVAPVGSRPGHPWQETRAAAAKHVDQLARQKLAVVTDTLALAGPDDCVTVSIQEMVHGRKGPEFDSKIAQEPSGLELDDGRAADRSVSGFDGYENVSFSRPGFDVLDLSLAGQSQSPTALRIPLFSDLAPAAFEKVMNLFQRQTHPPGNVVIRQGDPGDSIFFIAAGKLRVEKEKEGKRLQLATLQPGDFFGEFAYFAKAARDASVVADGLVEILELSRASVQDIVGTHPKVEQAMRNFYKQRVLENLLRESPLFSSLSADDHLLLLPLFQFRAVKKGTRVITEGDSPDAFYVVQRGAVEIRKESSPAPIATLGPGEFFGEYSMITGSPRTASAYALQDSDLVMLSQEGFRKLLQGRPGIVEKLREIAKSRLAVRPTAN